MISGNVNLAADQRWSGNISVCDHQVQMLHICLYQHCRKNLTQSAVRYLWSQWLLVFMHTITNTCPHARPHMYTHALTHVHTHTFPHTRTHTFPHTCTHTALTRVHAHTHAHVRSDMQPGNCCGNRKKKGIGTYLNNRRVITDAGSAVL